jgi:bifunctional UDP-N-acetylglucosamine pyrophosphorylase/glucosamine-1-phosphate N-acetyltransferase
MKSGTPKVLHQLCFKPIIYHILKSVSEISPKNVFVVVGHKGEIVEQYLRDNFPAFKVVYQKKQLGTAHAVKMAGKHIGNFADDCLVLPGDIPLVTAKTLKKAVFSKIRSKCSAAMITSINEDPQGYGRIIKDTSGKIVKVMEEADAAPEEKKINEVNTSIYCFDTLLLFKYLSRIDSRNSQGEYYLTDIIAALAGDGHKIIGIPVKDTIEVEGINDRKQLSRLENIMFEKISSQFMTRGVTFKNPATSYIDPEVKIGKDTVIEPGCIIRGKTIIGKDCIIGPFAQIDDSTVGDRTKINKSVIRGAAIGSGNNIGPNSFIRPGTVTGKDVKIGACCEIKKSVIGDRSKVPHLSYIGDAVIGRGVNVGAATVTCNYDGFLKNKTVIEDDVFIGSDTMLVAPVRLGKRSITAAGSVISQDVPDDNLAIERNKQENIKDGAARFREKRQKEKEKIKIINRKNKKNFQE